MLLRASHVKPRKMLPARSSARGYLQSYALLAAILFVCTATGRTQERTYPNPTNLPNPYRLVPGWPTLPAGMNGGRWGEVIRVSVDPKGNIWVFHRCFNTVPAGHATCVGRGDANPPILEFAPSGKLLRSLGA